VPPAITKEHQGYLPTRTFNARVKFNVPRTAVTRKGLRSLLSSLAL